MHRARTSPVLDPEEQSAVLPALAALQEDGAPAALRIRIQLMAALAQRRRAAARRRVLGTAAGILAAGALATPLLLLTGSAAAPSVADALAPAHKASVMHVTEPLDGRVTLPHVAGAGLAFPYWGERFGWTATGMRRDRLSGRTLTTVLYRRGRLWLAYTIVSGPPLRAPASAQTEVRNGIRLTSVSLAGRNVVTWLRRGHTCVLSGWNVPASELVALGSWRARGAIEY